MKLKEVRNEKEITIKDNFETIKATKGIRLPFIYWITMAISFGGRK